MTRTTNARIAGFTFLLYIVAGITSMAVAGRPHLTGFLSTLMAFSALVLGVTLWALTRDVDPDVAMMALGCRLLEAAPGEGTMFFAVGSTLFSWLLLRGRLIPAAMAWLGVLASALLVVVLPLQNAGLFGGAPNWASSITWLMWLPMLVFELAFAAWLLAKGVGEPARKWSA